MNNSFAGLANLDDNSTNKIDNITELSDEPLLLFSKLDLFDNEWVCILLSILIATFVLALIVCKVWSCISHRHKRRATLLIGLPFSGKTTLLSRLVSGIHTADTRMSMEPNEVELSVSNLSHLLPRSTSTLPSTSSSIVLIDYPGHRRLRDGLFTHLNNARALIVVIDSVTIQDDRHCGAAALAELLLSTIQSHAFAHVERILFACNKRDEITSYSSKAVRQILEKAMARAIESRGGDLSTVDSVTDAKGSLISANLQRKRTGTNIQELKSTRLLLQVDDNSNFSFDQLGLPYEFADVCAFPNAEKHDYNLNKVVEFIIPTNNS